MRESLVAMEAARTALILENAALVRLQLEGARLDLAEKHEQVARQHADDFFHHLFTFSVPVDGVTVGQCIGTLGAWSRLEPGCPIEIIIHSPGGAALPGLALFDYIRSLELTGHYITIRVLGYAASMAAVLLQAGSYRIMGAESFLLIHELSGQALGKMPEIEDATVFLQKIQDRICKILVSRSGGKLSRATLQKGWRRKDWWLNAEECLKYGLVDEIQ